MKGADFECCRKYAVCEHTRPPSRSASDAMAMEGDGHGYEIAQAALKGETK